jgi:hypothetical protein
MEKDKQQYERNVMPSTTIDIEKRGQKQKNLWVIFLLFSIIIISFLLYDIQYAPENISFNEKNMRYENILIKNVAENLIIQQYIEGEGMYASRGYDIYFLKEDEQAFKKIGRLPIPLGLSYLGNSKIVRYLLNKNEVLEMMRLNSGTLLAFAGGNIFRAESGHQNYNFEITGNIEVFGLEKGRGIMPQGYTEDSSGVIYWGEYWGNPEREPVKIWKSEDDGQSWDIAYEFSQGEIRHVHGVQYDHYSGLVWISTGDGGDDEGNLDSECKIGYLDDGDNFVSIGEGSQKWRAVSLLFTEEWIYWGMDGISVQYPDNEIWRWHRDKEKDEHVIKIDSHAFYSAVSNGKKIITTDGSGDGATLWATTDGGKWFKSASFTRATEGHFGTVRIITGPDGTFYITLHNLKEFNNSLLQVSVVE